MKRRLLVVDDDLSVREAMTELLAAEGYEVLVARNRAEALGHFQPGRVDLVVLDVNLGADDGWEVFQKMSEVDPLVPTVIVTAEHGQQERARAAGVEALIEKPIDVPIFLEIVRDLLTEPGTPPRERVCGSEVYCRYVAQRYETFLRLLQEREGAPMKFSSELQFLNGIFSLADERPDDEGPLRVIGGAFWGCERKKGSDIGCGA